VSAATTERRTDVGGVLSVAGVIARRNLLLFVRDRSAVFFSLLSPLILLAVYAFFLGGLQVESLLEQFPGAPRGDVRAFVDAWVFAGITMITSLTTGLAALSVFVEDGETGRFKDFLVSPIRRPSLVLGYMGATVVIAVGMSTFFLIVSQVYTFARGDAVMTGGQLVRCFLVILLSAGTFSALSVFAVTLVRTNGAFAALSTIVGTMVGFLAGAYIPIGALPAGAVNVMNALPFAQSAMLVRQPFTQESLEALTDGRPGSLAEVESFYGVTASVGSAEVTTATAVIVLLTALVVFTALGAWRMGRRIR